LEYWITKADILTMIGRRIEKSIQRGQPLEIEVDGKKIVAYKGETVATAMIATGLRTFRCTADKNEPRGMFCGIGLCFECRMVINGVPNTRTCQTLATPGCRVETQQGKGPLENRS
jgi:sarcosine oxidase subunit alpha